MDIRILRNLSSKLVECEERDRFFGNLSRLKVGTKEVEEFAKKNSDRMENLSSNLKGNHRRKLVIQAMDSKKIDNRELGKILRRKRNKLMRMMEDIERR